MIPVKIQEMILQLNKNQISIREMVRLVKVSRNTIRRVLRQGEVITHERRIKNPNLESLLPPLYKHTKGNAVRIQEILASDYQINVGYSTITRIIGQLALRPQKKLAGEYHFKPGEEMQHDTSPHRIIIDGKTVTAQCAALVLAYSRKIFIKYFPRFTRFEAKIFLYEAIQFMDGACQRCVIDNTSVILAGGSGSEAIIAPEMETLLRFFGSYFMAHAVGHADRKARVERPFYFVERNFLSGREFNSWEDLNKQARSWCENVANQKIKKILGMPPEAAFIQEKPYLIALPSVMPPIYDLRHRVVDVQGYINLEKQRYSVPQKYIYKQVDVYSYEKNVEVYHQHQCIAKHPRLIGAPNQRSKIPGHHEKLHRRSNRINPCKEEILLREDEILNQYIDQLKQRLGGKARRSLRKLLQLKRTYPDEAFYKAMMQALHYNLYDIQRVENIILKYVAGTFFNLEGNL